MALCGCAEGVWVRERQGSMAGARSPLGQPANTPFSWLPLPTGWHLAPARLGRSCGVSSSWLLTHQPVLS